MTTTNQRRLVGGELAGQDLVEPLNEPLKAPGQLDALCERPGSGNIELSGGEGLMNSCSRPYESCTQKLQFCWRSQIASKSIEYEP